MEASPSRSPSSLRSLPLSPSNETEQTVTGMQLVNDSSSAEVANSSAGDGNALYPRLGFLRRIAFEIRTHMDKIPKKDEKLGERRENQVSELVLHENSDACYSQPYFKDSRRILPQECPLSTQRGLSKMALSDNDQINIRIDALLSYQKPLPKTSVDLFGEWTVFSILILLFSITSVIFLVLQILVFGNTSLDVVVRIPSQYFIQDLNSTNILFRFHQNISSYFSSESHMRLSSEFLMISNATFRVQSELQQISARRLDTLVLKHSVPRHGILVEQFFSNLSILFDQYLVSSERSRQLALENEVRSFQLNLSTIEFSHLASELYMDLKIRVLGARNLSFSSHVALDSIDTNQIGINDSYVQLRDRLRTMEGNFLSLGINPGLVSSRFQAWMTQIQMTNLNVSNLVMQLKWSEIGIADFEARIMVEEVRSLRWNETFHVLKRDLDTIDDEISSLFQRDVFLHRSLSVAEGIEGSTLVLRDVKRNESSGHSIDPASFPATLRIESNYTALHVQRGLSMFSSPEGILVRGGGILIDGGVVRGRDAVWNGSLEVRSLTRLFGGLEVVDGDVRLERNMHVSGELHSGRIRVNVSRDEDQSVWNAAVSITLHSQSSMSGSSTGRDLALYVARGASLFLENVTFAGGLHVEGDGIATSSLRVVDGGSSWLSGNLTIEGQEVWIRGHNSSSSCVGVGNPRRFRVDESVLSSFGPTTISHPPSSMISDDVPALQVDGGRAYDEDEIGFRSSMSWVVNRTALRVSRGVSRFDLVEISMDEHRFDSVPLLWIQKGLNVSSLSSSLVPAVRIDGGILSCGSGAVFGGRVRISGGLVADGDESIVSGDVRFDHSLYVSGSVVWNETIIGASHAVFGVDVLFRGGRNESGWVRFESSSRLLEIARPVRIEFPWSKSDRVPALAIEGAVQVWNTSIRIQGGVFSDQVATLLVSSPSSSSEIALHVERGKVVCDDDVIIRGSLLQTRGVLVNGSVDVVDRANRVRIEGGLRVLSGVSYLGGSATIVSQWHSHDSHASEGNGTVALRVVHRSGNGTGILLSRREHMDDERGDVEDIDGGERELEDDDTDRMYVGIDSRDVRSGTAFRVLRLWNGTGLEALVGGAEGRGVRIGLRSAHSVGVMVEEVEREDVWHGATGLLLSMFPNNGSENGELQSRAIYVKHGHSVFRTIEVSVDHVEGWQHDCVVSNGVGGNPSMCVHVGMWNGSESVFSILLSRTALVVYGVDRNVSDALGGAKEQGEVVTRGIHVTNASVLMTLEGVRVAERGDARGVVIRMEASEDVAIEVQQGRTVLSDVEGSHLYCSTRLSIRSSVPVEHDNIFVDGRVFNLSRVQILSPLLLSESSPHVDSLRHLVEILFAFENDMLEFLSSLTSDTAHIIERAALISFSLEWSWNLFQNSTQLQLASTDRIFGLLVNQTWDWMNSSQVLISSLIPSMDPQLSVIREKAKIATRYFDPRTWNLFSATNFVQRVSVSGISAGSNKFAGGVLASNGKIYMIPFDANHVAVFDPESLTAEILPHTLLSGLEKYVGGVLATNELIYAIPSTASLILVIDPVRNLLNFSMFPSIPGTSKYAGGVLASDGRVYGIPHSASNVLRIDPLASTISTAMTVASGYSKYSSGVLAPNGRIYCIPFDATNVLVINPLLGTTTTIGSLPSSTGKYAGGALAPNGKIYATPYSATNVLIIDPTTDTVDSTTISFALPDTFDVSTYSGSIDTSRSISEWRGFAFKLQQSVTISHLRGRANTAHFRVAILSTNNDPTAPTPTGVLADVSLNSGSSGIQEASLSPSLVLAVNSWYIIATGRNSGPGSMFESNSLNGNSLLSSNPFISDWKPGSSSSWSAYGWSHTGLPSGLVGLSQNIQDHRPVVGFRLASSLSPTSNFLGATCAPNGMIYFVPFQSEKIIVVNPSTNTWSELDIPSGADSEKFYGGILAHNGKVYAIPYDSGDVLIVDPGIPKIPWSWMISMQFNKF